MIPGIDMDSGIKRYGSKKLFLRILKSFVKSAPKLLEKLRSPTEEGLADYAINVHGFKGACYNISADSLGDQAKELEFAGKSGDFTTIAEKNGALIESAEKLLADLEESC